MAKQYPNRSDLRGGKVAARTVPGQTYGKAKEQMQAQRAVPMAAPPTDQPPSPVQATQPQAAPLVPGQIADLTAPTQRPNEPITAGMDFGPGPTSAMFGPNNRPAPGSNRDLAERVRAIASLYPNPALLQLLSDLET